ncbi:prepilin peptidase [Actomonas aquatica]|uniref:Prepilin peptidase n=1 Tax=Actomonas aquatica TaxID=2866162 RepID=A0ABZ1C457_9BACT|nr:A24 family peptidase [Opitutus sp. WL0086]WRQ86503.1 prepilin peptidase [Opitutus sp. WL0086]
MLSDLQQIDALFPALFPTAVFIFGALIGSFLNVVIYRVPKGESIVSPPSHCACGQPIKWYDNLPILSWFILRGRARCCGAPYSFRYPAIEAFTGGLFLLCWLTHPPLVAFAGLVLLGLLIPAMFIDLDHMIIPDGITIGGTVVGVMVSFLIPSLHGFGGSGIFVLDGMRSATHAILGVFVGSGLILWIALIAEALLKKEAMGFGDVKFMGVIGAFLGWKGAVFAMFGGAIVGTAWFAIALLIQAVTRQKQSAALRAETPEGEETEVGFGAHVPFGPMLAIAAGTYLLGGYRPFNAYLDQFLQIW